MSQISVIVPCYNGAAFLARCLDSLAGQTVFEQMEIIVVNDGSTDETQSIVERYSHKHPSIRVIKVERMGLPQARRVGVENAQGQQIGFVDADDWIEPQMYESMLAKMAETGADIVCCGISQDSSDGRCLFSVPPLAEDTSLSGEEALARMQRRHAVFPYMWNKLYKAELFAGIDFPQGTFVGEDYAINVQVFAKAASVAFCMQTCYHYVQESGSVSRGGYSENYEIAYKYYDKNVKKLEEKFPQNKTLFRNYVLTEYLAFLVAMARNKTYNIRLEKDIRQYAQQNSRGYFAADYVENKFKLCIFVLLVNRYLSRLALRCAVILRLV